jgi:hypothetical protein
MKVNMNLFRETEISIGNENVLQEESSKAKETMKPEGKYTEDCCDHPISIGR